MKRKEDPAQLKGAGTFVDDIKLEGMLYCALVRSPYAKARIKEIRKPDDHRLLDFLDGPELAKITKSCSKFELGDRKFEQRALTIAEVHYVGEAVAAVLAKTRYEAEDLLEEVNVIYEPLAPSVGLEHRENRSIDFWPNDVAFEKALNFGDFDSALQQSSHHFDLETRISRQAAIPIETRGNISSFNATTKELSIWTPTKGPHSTRAGAATVFSLPEQSVRVMVPNIGGGFGVKAYYYPEEVVTAAFSIRNGNPVKWIGTRSEDLESTMQARDQIHRATICLDENLLIKGFKDEFLIDIGTPGSLSQSPSQRLIPLLSGCYKIPNIRVSCKGIATNKPPMGPIRGNGRPEAILIIERAIEHAARMLGVDPIEIRKRNLLKSSDLPYDNHLGSVYDSGNYGEALDRVVKSSDYYRLKAGGRSRNEGKFLGIGFSSYVEDTGGPPGKGGRPQYETAIVRVERDGTVTAYSGSSPHGQGHETTFSEIIARELSISPEKVRVKFGDTAIIPYGVGSMGSRSGPIGGSAVYLAAKEIRNKMITIAGAILGSHPNEIKLEGGQFLTSASENDHKSTISFSEVVSAAYEQRKETKNLPLGLTAEVYFEPQGLTFSYGVVCAVVEVDSETGRATLQRITALDDSGHVIDREIVEGQLHGGVAHAIGNAFYEKISYSKEGQPFATNLLDYEIPTSFDVPEMQLLEMETPSKMNPLGVKGAGEGGTIGAFAAIVNAVGDAIRKEPLQVPLEMEEIVSAIAVKKENL